MFSSNLYADEFLIIPKKKPILDKITKQKKIEQGIIRPKPKPTKKSENIKVSKDVIKPESKPKNKKEEKDNKKDKVKVIEKSEKKIDFLVPQKKPLVVKKTTTAKKTKSKYYSQKDFDIAKKAIKAMEKRQWSSAVTLSKKSKDKSIYKFIQWRHLLTTGNQASFYDYMTFINNNKNYPRIKRIR